MTSLSDVYDGGVGSVAGRRQRALGAGLFVAGGAAVATAIPLATTDLATAIAPGTGIYEAREVSGVLAGLGLPAAFVGILAVIPAGRVVRAAAAIGAGLAVLGVAMFVHAYPEQWLSTEPALAALTVLVYSLGAIVTFWCTFAGLATFRTRGEPGGTAHLDVTRTDTVRVVSEGPEGSGIGGVGLTETPDGGVETQTNRGSAAEDATGTDLPDGEDTGSRAGEDTSGSRAGDGAGSGTAPVVEPGVGGPDPYCGNCVHFAYARVDDEMQPYCTHHEDILDDMDACGEWTPNG